MTATGPPLASGTQDPRYLEGMAHLQAGEWPEAIHCFAGLARDYPDDPAVERALEQADFRASLDSSTRVRAKRWVFPWRRLVVVTLILLAVGALALQGGRMIQRQVAPALSQLQEEQRLAELEAEARAAFEHGEFLRAEPLYQELLTAIPDHEAALQALAQIAEDREIAAWYSEGLAFQEAGDYELALERYNSILVPRPRYRDVTQRIEDINLQQDRDDLFAEAEADLAAGRAGEAASKYEQLRERFANYNRDIIARHLYDAYMQLGHQLIEQDPPATEGVSQALESFGAALALEPRNPDPALEQQLAVLYLEGQTRYRESDWEAAIGRLQAVYD
ncbi:tetratricopeptide repeat protein, partial [Chloroflexota bacterium]